MRLREEPVTPERAGQAGSPGQPRQSPNWHITHLSNVLQYRKEVSNLDIGTEKEEKGNSMTAQSFLFRLAGLWVGEGTLLSKAVCLSRRVCLCSGQGVEKVHTLCYFSAFSSCLALNL